MNFTTRGISLLGVALSLLNPLSVSASEIAANIQLSFNETADFSDGIDKLITLDAAKVNARLLNNRLGTFSSGNAVFVFNANHSVSIIDPGVTTLPAEDRNLFQVSGSATASGGLLPDAASLNIGATWFCKNTTLQCTSNEAFSTVRNSTQTFNLAIDSTTLLTPIRLQSSITAVTPLTENYTLNYGKVHLNGSLQVNALFTAKSSTQYVHDALVATSGTTGNQRWGAAANDIQSLRNGSLTDVAVANNLEVSKTPELEAAHRLLAIARDGATILTTGNAVGASFSSEFALTRQLWNVAATAEPALGRSLAGSNSETFSNQNVAAEVEVLRMLLNGADDASFVAGVDNALSNPSTGSAPLLSFDGSLLGLNGATMSVFYLGASNGRVEIELAAADRYALWRTAYSFDRIAFLEGAEDGVTVLGGNADGTQIRLGDEQYVGEIYSDELFYLSGSQTASRLQLNNFYNNQLLVVASWAVTPVPEPSAWCLLLFGLVLIGRMKKSN
ncbi:PEP-CTERM sorting domain-containing protein [Methylophilus sp. Leaf414]|uniref:PEP-CTERM sorting domain-containing protein n=1 Tax=Methylophilus sp. Leaf414 TaxID=1736371 RepID=UPI00070054FF|nr:PEP-CTERM sorting domain-containing protein [Methylophilus sp. Leaf414]KQT36159.1 hypothetical protein ASG24_07785 [Methylophilus sp. Leaf414]